MQGSRLAGAAHDLVTRLQAPGPLLAVELRPPRLGLDAERSIDVWIDMHHAVQRLARDDTLVLLTDDAAGLAEEESLAHLSANLGRSAELRNVLPFLTCNHPLDYCRLFVRRAAEMGVAGVTVVGGDPSPEVERCVPHGKDLRQMLRLEQPRLPLGGWANPNRDPVEQARFVAARDFSADYVLTQIVSHHSLGPVERFVSELRRLGVATPVVFGVFLYRSPNPRTLSYLGRYFPVPVRGITGDFEAGMGDHEICAESIRRLRDVGAEKVYLSNLPTNKVNATLQNVKQRLL